MNQSEYTVGMLWMGDTLSFLEQLCLKSFVDQGQAITLFSYRPVSNVPEGVILANAAQILPEGEVLLHHRTGSPALHSDRFRYHLLAKCPGMIWADTDAYCIKPLAPEEGFLFSWESAHGVNGGVLALPPESATLAKLIDFTSQPYPIPPWLSAQDQAALIALHEAGTPMHVSDMAWGVWGPRALTHFLHETEEIAYALPQSVLYPFAYRERNLLLKPDVKLEERVKPDTVSLHFYGRRLRQRLLASHPQGLPRPRSVLGRLLRQHGIDPAAAPMSGILVTEGEVALA